MHATAFTYCIVGIAGGTQRPSINQVASGRKGTTAPKTPLAGDGRQLDSLSLPGQLTNQEVRL
jgi:hypothetical protein